MLELQHSGSNQADVYSGMRLVARFAFKPKGRVMVRVFCDGHEENVENMKHALKLVRDRIKNAY